jgi:hypothetical protein
LILALTLTLTSVLFLKSAYLFLATTHRVDADTVVVEDWVHEYGIKAAANEFRSGSYKRVFSTGGPGGGNWRIHQ